MTRPRTAVQKLRDIVLVIFDVEQKDIALATGADRGILSNIFRDRHRSPGAEAGVIEFLNGRYQGLSKEDKAMLKSLGFDGEIDRETMGWPFEQPAENTDG